MLEIQIAFALLGIGLAGLCPFVVMQLRQLGNVGIATQGQLVPPTRAWDGSSDGHFDQTYYSFPGTTPGRGS